MFCQEKTNSLSSLLWLYSMLFLVLIFFLSFKRYVKDTKPMRVSFILLQGFARSMRSFYFFLRIGRLILYAFLLQEKAASIPCWYPFYVKPKKIHAEGILAHLLSYAFCSGPSYAFLGTYLLGTFKRYNKLLFFLRIGRDTT